MDFLFDAIHSSIIQNFIIIPLAIIGVYQLFRSVGNQLEQDVQDNHLTGWAQKVYIAITVLGIICFISIFN